MGRSQTQRTGYVLSTTGQMLWFLGHELPCSLLSGKNLAVLDMNANRFLGFGEEESTYGKECRSLALVGSTRPATY